MQFDADLSPCTLQCLPEYVAFPLAMEAYCRQLEVKICAKATNLVPASEGAVPHWEPFGFAEGQFYIFALFLTS